MPQIKAMPLFFIDNQGAWPKTAELLGDGFVIWPDEGKYPSYVPIAVASHPEFDGMMAVQGGNRGIVLTFLKGVKTQADISKAMSKKGAEAPEQYRIAVDSLIHRVMLMRSKAEAGIQDDAVHPLSILSWLAKSHPREGAVLASALKKLLPATQAVTAPGGEVSATDAYTLTEQMLATVEQGLQEALLSMKL